jgi:VWFA-related protein
MSKQGMLTICSARPKQGLRVVLSLGLAGCVLLSGIHDALAQGSDVTVAVEEVDTSTFPAVRVRVSVRDHYGVPVQDLEAEHFELVEDGAATFTPTAVEAEKHPRAQVSLALVIDLYRTLRGEPIEAAQQATEDLLTDLLDEPDDPDRAAFVGVRQGLGTDPSEVDDEYEVGFTNDRNKLLNVINFLHERIQNSGPGTPLYDAVIKAIRMAEATEPVGHRALIVMTDGEDRESVNTDSDTMQRASNARTPVFTVGLSNSGLDEQYLRRLAENTGGTYQAAETPDDFSLLFSNVLATLRTQYVLTYDSGLIEDGRTHSVLVRVRTPTQLEGFQEYRVEMPGAAEEETEDEVEATPETPAPDSTPETAPAPEEEDLLVTARDWVQDNLLLAGLAVGALALLFLALVIVVVIVVRKRRADTQVSVRAPEPPAYPAAPMPGLDVETGGTATASTGDARVASGGTMPAPPPTPIGVGPSVPPPAFPEAAYPPSSADRTRILERKPKLSIVALLIDRDRPEDRMEVSKPVVTIGRSSESDLTVDHNTVSRQHAVIKLEDDSFRLYDLGSTNGTFVGGQQIHEPMTLEDGAAVRFGERAFIFKVIRLET